MAKKLLLALHDSQGSDDKVAGACARFELALPDDFQVDHVAVAHLRGAWKDVVEACVSGRAQ